MQFWLLRSLRSYWNISAVYCTFTHIDSPSRVLIIKAWEVEATRTRIPKINLIILIIINLQFKILSTTRGFYSRLPKGVTNSIISTVASGSWSIISAILSNGEFLCLITDDTGNSKKFWEFLCILIYTIDFVKMRSISEWIITLDNASTHKAKRSFETIANLNINAIFLHPYSPMLAPIELFLRMVKNKIKQLHNKNIWFNDLEGRIEIFYSLKDLRKPWISNMWIEFISNAKRSILRYY